MTQLERTRRDPGIIKRSFDFQSNRNHAAKFVSNPNEKYLFPNESLIFILSWKFSERSNTGRLRVVVSDRWIINASDLRLNLASFDF